METFSSPVILNPRFSPEKNTFDCFCPLQSSFSTLTKYNHHRKSKKHKLWCAEQKIIDDSIIPPDCDLCFDSMSDPITHKKQCEANRGGSVSYSELFQQELDFTLDRFVNCNHCQGLILLGTLSTARRWKENVYCPNCFYELFSEQEQLNQQMLKLALLHQWNATCPLCCQMILTKDETMYEHMNPFLKTHDPSACLRKGESVSKIFQECTTQGVQLVHHMCGQLKTRCELKTQQIASKKNLKLHPSADTINKKKRKADLYQEKFLPEVSKFIYQWKKTQDPPKCKRRIMNPKKQKIFF